MARVSWMGLDMDGVTATRIVAAIRGLFPDLTTGLTDKQAAQAAVRQVAREWVMTWESQQGTTPEAASAAAVSAAVAAQAQAVHNAVLATTDIQLT